MMHKVRHLLHQRHLLRDFVGRELRQQYVGSAGGVLWTILHPLILLLVYTFVFSVILRVRFEGEAGVSGFALYLYCGMLPWQAFSGTLSRSTAVLVRHGNLIRNVRFPAKVLPVTVTLVDLVNEAIGLALLGIAIVAMGGGLAWTVILLPLLLALQVAFTLGLSMLLATAHVFFRDVEHLVRVGLVVWMFLTPLFYPESRVPDRFRWVVEVNPMAHLVRMYRAVLLEGRVPAATDLLLFVAWSSLAFGLGYLTFTRNHARFADVL